VTAASGFRGFRRPDGRVGTRNHVLVVPTVICASVVAERIAAAAGPLGSALPHLAGCGQLGPDMSMTHSTLAAYCGHPNVGAVVVVALGCEQVVAQRLADEARRHGKPAEIVGIQAEGGTLRATDKGTAIAQRMAEGLAAAARSWVDASELVLSLKCGGSDYTSGLASNPALGRVADRLVDLGGSAVLGEVAEIMGAEHLLAARATRPATSERLIQIVTRVEHEARALGLDIRGTQPSPGNIRGGLTTIEEKSQRRPGGLSCTAHLGAVVIRADPTRHRAFLRFQRRPLSHPPGHRGQSVS
jgi:altronate dehydratase large subunit